MNEVERFYDAGAEWEWERLDRHRNEFAVTMRALDEYLPTAPANVLDCGGGPGRYAIALAQRGYTVTLLDLALGNLNFARTKADEAGVALAGYIHGNALDLSALQESSFDAVLLMGPLYHLQTVAERQRAIQEARRVLKPGGILVAAFINRYGPIIEMCAFAPEWPTEHPGAVAQLLAHGTVPPGETKFPGAYFAHPTEVKPLLEGEGFESIALLSAEGVAAYHEEKVNALTGAAWETWTELNYRLAKDPSVLGASGHLLYISRKTP